MRQVDAGAAARRSERSTVLMSLGPRACGKMPPMATVGSSPPSRRRWLQFSLRGLLLFTVVIAVPLGWAMNRVQQERMAVAALRKIGCEVGSLKADSGSLTIQERLRKLLGDDEFMNATYVSGANSEITDAGLVHLQGLTELQELDLSGTQVTDAGLVHLEGLIQLESLDLLGTQVTDAGLVHLRGLTRIKSLNLGNTRVTDAGLIHVHGLVQLQGVYIVGTQVTYTGVLKFVKALPNCEILGSPNQLQPK
jgi:Leucine Rich Repeat (LRR) protein